MKKKDLDNAAGCAWRLLAVDKAAWRVRVDEDEWILQRDIPWATGQQWSLTQ